MADPDFNRLPVIIKHRGLLQSWGVVALGVLVALAPVVIDVPWGLCALVGGMLILLGIFSIGRQKIIEIDGHSVRVRYEGIFRREQPDWQEPVSAFKCVRLTLDPVETHVVFTLFLVHPDRAKWLTLGSWTDRSRFDFPARDNFEREARARNVWREAAHALNLPAIETGPTLWSDSADDAYMQEALDALPKARMSEKSRPTSP